MCRTLLTTSKLVQPLGLTISNIPFTKLTINYLGFTRLVEQSGFRPGFGVRNQKPVASWAAEPEGAESNICLYPSDPLVSTLAYRTLVHQCWYQPLREAVGPLYLIHRLRH